MPKDTLKMQYGDLQNHLKILKNIFETNIILAQSSN